MDNVLATIVMEYEHTGEEIARLTEECLLKNGLKSNSVIACVRDDAANMQKSCRLLEINRFLYHFNYIIKNFLVFNAPRIYTTWQLKMHLNQI